MTILLTNDDGIHAKGLRCLIDALSGIADIHVVAPMRERSGSSHAVTIVSDVAMDVRGERMYALDGSPADCVRAGIQCLVGGPVDLVISGINRGVNLGYDIHYSGTVAGAREAVIEGVSGMAVSLASYDPDADYSFAAHAAAEMAKHILAYDRLYPKHRHFVNLNVPEKPLHRTLKRTRLSHRFYRDTVRVLSREGSQCMLAFRGDVPEGDESVDTDFGAVKAGYVSVTPLSLFPDYREHTQQDTRYLTEVIL